jgi:hypothetical protein
MTSPLQNGDINDTTTLETFLPPSVRSVSWNGKSMDLKWTDYGSVVAILNGAKSPTLPSLGPWRVTDG